MSDASGDGSRFPARRSTRRVVRNKHKQPNPEHYVGYVADEETPEMIMRKFEQLDRAMELPSQTGPDAEQLLPSAAGDVEDRGPAGREQGSLLNRDRLQKLLEATSAFEMREVFRNDGDPPSLSDPDSSDAEFQLSDEDSDDDAAAPKRRTYKQRVATGARRRRSGSGIAQLRLPEPPLPLSWGRTVAPFTAPESDPPVPLPCLDWTDHRRRFLGVMIHPSWTRRGVSALEQLPLPELCPDGFLFLWIPKAQLQTVWRIAKRWQFSYVETLTWIQLRPNNKVQRRPAEAPSILPSSHATLYIFRRGGRDIEIKHQRSSDVVFDVAFSDRIPSEVYRTIETMLPSARGKLLEIWTPPSSVVRPGWVHVSDAP